MKALLRHRLLVGTASLTLVAGITYSCKDFLDTAAQAILDEPTVTTLSGVEGSLIATYRALDCTTATNANWGCAASNWVFGSVTSDDAYKGSQLSDQPGIQDIELYNWSTGEAQAYLNVKWRAVYEGVVRSNRTIRLLRNVRQLNPGEISDALARNIEGEARFLRAHFHFEAWRMWERIPYYREDDTDIRKTNVGVTGLSVAAELLSDLDSAIAMLPATPRGGQAGRATSWTARAYKGRVQVYAAQYAPVWWDSALVTLRAVRGSGVYALETSMDRVWTGFPEFANGRETILAYQASANDGEPNGDNANWGERLNFPHGDSPLGSC
jgi:starch-binding outer membrane protein, SusD/RagB family